MCEKQVLVGSIDTKRLDGFDNSEMIKGLTKNVDILSKQIAVQSQSLDEIVSLAKEKEKMLASIPAVLAHKKGLFLCCIGLIK